MTYVVTERCVDCRYTYCVADCPVDCFWMIDAPHRMLVIDPGTCVHCDACLPLCPVNAIWPDTDLPPEYEGWRAFNAERFAAGVQVHEAGAPLETALLLEEVQARERERGWAIAEPPGATT
jgi:ferredoxin